jgi:Xaa-Pro aminopeptidase
MTRTVARDGQCQERDVQLYIIEQFKARKLTWPDDPIVAVNANSASPHYAPDQHRSTPITPGDWVLIDLWCREEAPAGTGQAPLGDDAIYSDITWTGYVGPRVPPTHQRVFDVVRDARDAALHLAQQAWQAGTPVQGWQLDDAARAVLIAAGLGPHIKHRTGHSLSPGPLVHGIGMNLDNLESHDTRRMLPQTGFTIEPGAYGVIDDHGRAFGVRNEINVYVDPQLGPVVTSCVQNQPVLIA